MTPRPTLAQLLAETASWMLAASPARVVLDVIGDGSFRLTADAAPEGDGPVERAACVRWEMRVSSDGASLDFVPDEKRVTGSLQEPEVLFALRDVAAAHPGSSLVVRLPRGTRDIQRARAGLPSGLPE